VCEHTSYHSGYSCNRLLTTTLSAAKKERNTRKTRKTRRKKEIKKERKIERRKKEQKEIEIERKFRTHQHDSTMAILLLEEPIGRFPQHLHNLQRHSIRRPLRIKVLEQLYITCYDTNTILK
jgi:hypothetical protein